MKSWVRIPLAVLVLICLACPSIGAAPPDGSRLWVALPEAAGQYQLMFETKVNGQPWRMGFLLYLPRGYEASKDRVGALLYLHGEGERGNDLRNLLRSGPQRYLIEPASKQPPNTPKPDPNLREAMKLIVISPQCPGDRRWDQAEAGQALLAMIDQLSNDFRIDAERLYAAGHGMGGAGAIQLAMIAPDRIAAAAPMAAPVPRDMDAMAAKAKYAAFRSIAFAKDQGQVDAATRLYDALRPARARAALELSNDQDVVARYCADPKFYEWFAQYKRLSAQERAAQDAAPLSEPGFYRMKFAYKAANQEYVLQYMLYLPPGYDKSNERWPGMVFLHNHEQRGTDPGRLFTYGPAKLLKEDAKFTEAWKFVTIAPLCPGDREWTHPQMLAATSALLADLSKQLRLDPERLCVSGAGNMGGAGAYALAASSPETFASVVPIGAQPMPTDVIEEKLRSPATWIIAGARDGGAVAGANQMHAALRMSRGRARMTIIPDADQNSAWVKAYADPELHKWVASQKRLTAEQRAALDALPGEPGLYKVRLGGKDASLPCLLLLPKGYEQANSRWPLLLYLHGQNERGKDLKSLLTVGPGRYLREDPKLRDAQQMAIVMPQCPPDKDWNALGKSLLAILDEAGAKLRLDANRVYVSGIDAGGAAAWKLAMDAPDRFAAIAPIAAPAPQPQEIARRLKHVALCLVANAGDGNAVTALSGLDDALRVAKCRSQLGLVPQWDQLRFLSDPAFYQWFLGFHRLSAKERTDFDAQSYLQPGHYRLKFKATVGKETIEFPYLLFLPSGYEKNTSQRWPMLVFLHGAGEGGTDYNGLFIHGPDGQLRGNYGFRRDYPLIQLSPQTTRGWDPVMIKAVVQLIGDVIKNHRVDADRVFATGLSMGGTGTWAIAQEAPRLFNGIAPICGRSVTPEKVGKTLRDMNVWVIVGSADGDFTTNAKQMADALRKGGNVTTELTIVPNEGHGVWGRYYPDLNFYQWFVKQKRVSR